VDTIWNWLEQLNQAFLPFRGEIFRVGASALIFGVGILIGRIWAMWRRYRQQRLAERGQSDDVATIEKILLERRPDGTDVLRIRSVGRDPIETIFPNIAARDEFQARASVTTLAAPLVAMDGKMGSYLLQELAIWVCGQLKDQGFDRDVWVMAPAYERGEFYLGGHFLSTVLLIRQEDLARFRSWETCSHIEVEHASHGERILTLMDMAREFDRQAKAVAERRASGKRSNYEETMYVLDLGLDTRSADLPTKPVPWERFESILEKHGIKPKQLAGAR
jgi:hypothetical protein